MPRTDFATCLAELEKSLAKLESAMAPIRKSRQVSSVDIRQTVTKGPVETGNAEIARERRKLAELHRRLETLWERPDASLDVKKQERKLQDAIDACQIELAALGASAANRDSMNSAFSERGGTSVYLRVDGIDDNPFGISKSPSIRKEENGVQLIANSLGLREDVDYDEDDFNNLQV